jgi:hypothetical protein
VFVNIHDADRRVLLSTSQNTHRHDDFHICGRGDDLLLLVGCRSEWHSEPEVFEGMTRARFIFLSPHLDYYLSRDGARRGGRTFILMGAAVPFSPINETNKCQNYIWARWRSALSQWASKPPRSVGKTLAIDARRLM